MAVFLLILKIIGGILLSILALVIIALFIKVRITADYAEKSSIVIQWLFIRIPVFPMQKKAKKKAADDPQQAPPATDAVDNTANAEPASAQATPVEETPVQPESAPTDPAATAAPAEPAKKDDKPDILKIFFESNGGVEGLILLIKEFFSYLGSFFGGMLHAFVIDELMVDMVVTKSDAAQTAIYYGQLCSAVYPMLGAFVTKYKVRQYDFSITPDFLARKNSAEMHVSFWFRPATLIGVVLLLVGRLVFKFGAKVVIRMVKPLMNARKGAKTEKAE